MRIDLAVNKCEGRLLKELQDVSPIQYDGNRH